MLALGAPALAPAAAQEPESAAAPAPESGAAPAPAQAPDQEAAPAPTEDAAQDQPAPRRDGDVFVPTEEIEADEEVTFPVDI